MAVLREWKGKQYLVLEKRPVIYKVKCALFAGRLSGDAFLKPNASPLKTPKMFLWWCYRFAFPAISTRTFLFLILAFFMP